MHFDWNHTFTASDMPSIDWPDLIGQFSYAVRERLRLVLRDTSAYDLWLTAPTGPKAGAATTPFACRFDVSGLGQFLGWPLLGQEYGLYAPIVTGEFTDASLTFNFNNTLRASRRQAPNGYNPAFNSSRPLSAYDGWEYEPAYFQHQAWNAIHNAETGGHVRYVPFTFPLAQRIVTALSFFFIAPDIDYEGWNYSSRVAAAAPYASRYYPNVTEPFGRNLRNYFVQATGVNFEDAPGGTYGRNRPPPLGWSYPLWPGPGGWTRKREREVTRLSAVGTDGQRARFVFAKAGIDPVSVGYTGISDRGSFNAAYESASIKGIGKWIIDPKPLLSDVQIGGLPESLDAEKGYSGRILKRVSGAWVADADQTTPPDTITLRGHMQPGDLVGPWLFNELRDAINQIGVTAWTASFNSGTGERFPTFSSWAGGVDYYPTSSGTYGIPDGREDIYGVGHVRHYGCNQPPFGPRTVRIYKSSPTGTTSTTYGTVDTYSSYTLVARFANTTARAMQSSTGVPYTFNSDYNFYALIDWRPAFAYRSDTNPASPPAWPAMPPAWV